MTVVMMLVGSVGEVILGVEGFLYIVRVRCDSSRGSWRGSPMGFIPVGFILGLLMCGCFVVVTRVVVAGDR